MNNGKKIGKSSLLKENVYKFVADNNLEPPKCISDRILLYIRYGIDHFSKQEFYEYMSVKRWEELKPIYEKQGREASFKTLKDMHGMEWTYGYMTYKLIEQDRKELDDNCMKIYELVRGDMRYTNRNPLSVAVGIIYIAATMLSNLSITQNDFRECFGVSTPSVANHYKMILKDFKNDIEGLKIPRNNQPRIGQTWR
jgi:transcription initiation factor TFIIIB Brf1 subunit/transcription initiation factor TFIIB